MDANTVTLIIGLAGIVATLLSASLGFYFTHKARSTGLREAVFTQQLALIPEILYRIGRFRVFATILTDTDTPFIDRAREDCGHQVHEFSILVDKAAAVVPTELWVEVSRASGMMTSLITDFDESGKMPDIHPFVAQAAKVALMSRSVLGVDELSSESQRLFSSGGDLERLARLDFEQLPRAKRGDGV